jgi:hypothetical protein
MNPYLSNQQRGIYDSRGGYGYYSPQQVSHMMPEQAYHSMLSSSSSGPTDITQYLVSSSVHQLSIGTFIEVPLCNGFTNEWFWFVCVTSAYDKATNEYKVMFDDGSQRWMRLHPDTKNVQWKEIVGSSEGHHKISCFKHMLKKAIPDSFQFVQKQFRTPLPPPVPAVVASSTEYHPAPSPDHPRRATHIKAEPIVSLPTTENINQKKWFKYIESAHITCNSVCVFVVCFCFLHDDGFCSTHPPFIHH